MPDPSVVPDAPPAAPSAAPVAPPTSDVSLDSLSETDLNAWRMDGKFPHERQVETPPAGSSPATPVQDPAASTDATSAPASEAGTARPDPRATENRIPQLLEERKRERERADRAERRAAELEARLQPSQTPPAASSPAPAGLVKPDPEAYQYGTSDPGYLEALADYRVDARLASERQRWEEGQRQIQARQEFERVVSAFNEKAEAARAKHPDFDAIALQSPTEIKEGSLADLWVREDDAGAEILYHLQQPTNAAERRRILALPYNKQIKELVRLGDRLTSDPTADHSATAPPPPPILRTRTTPADPVERALADGTDDEATGRYIEAQNRREMARMKR